MQENILQIHFFLTVAVCEIKGLEGTSVESTEIMVSAKVSRNDKIGNQKLVNNADWLREKGNHSLQKKCFRQMMKSIFSALNESDGQKVHISQLRMAGREGDILFVDLMDSTPDGGILEALRMEDLSMTQVYPTGVVQKQSKAYQPLVEGKETDKLSDSLLLKSLPWTMQKNPRKIWWIRRITVDSSTIKTK